MLAVCLFGWSNLRLADREIFIQTQIGISKFKFIRFSMLIIRHTLPRVKPQVGCQIEQKACRIAAAFLPLFHLLATHQPAIRCIAPNNIALLLSFCNIILLAIQTYPEQN